MRLITDRMGALRYIGPSGVTYPFVTVEVDEDGTPVRFAPYTLDTGDVIDAAVNPDDRVFKPSKAQSVKDPDNDPARIAEADAAASAAATLAAEQDAAAAVEAEKAAAEAVRVAEQEAADRAEHAAEADAAAQAATEAAAAVDSPADAAPPDATPAPATAENPQE